MSSRLSRAFKQPIYLLNMEPNVNSYKRVFNVMGTTGNNYVVTINEHPSCTCPDNSHNHNTCKHIYFVMLRVMKIQVRIKHNYSGEELLVMFQNIPNFIENNLLGNHNGSQKASTKALMEDTHIGGHLTIQQKFDDVCPICLDDLGDVVGLLDYCKYSCGKSVHKKCFEIWKNQSIASFTTTKCIFCRHNWTTPTTHNHHHQPINIPNYETESDDDNDDDGGDVDNENIDNSDMGNGNWDESDEDDMDGVNGVNGVDNVGGMDDVGDVDDVGNVDDVDYVDYANDIGNFGNVDTSNYRVAELQALCKDMGIASHGTKHILIERLHLHGIL